MQTRLVSALSALSALLALSALALGSSCVVGTSDSELGALPTPAFPVSFTVVPTNVRPVLFDSEDIQDDVSFVRRFEDGSEVDVEFIRGDQRPFEADAYLIDPGALVPGEARARCRWHRAAGVSAQRVTRSRSLR